MKFLPFYIMTTLSLFASNPSVQNEGLDMSEQEREDQKLCLMFQKKISEFELQARENMYAKIALQSYKTRADIFCSKE